MDAIVLVGGQGTRLRPLTARRHKSLVPVCNRPAIEYLFAWLGRSGIRRIVLALGQMNEDLALAYPPGTRGGIEHVIVMERARLESGGAIRNAVATAGIEGRFLVVNGDIYVDFDFRAALAAHEAAGAELTLALCEVPNPSSFGVAAIDEESMVTGFIEKPPPGTEPSNLINAGAWIFEPQLVAEIPPGPVRVEETLFPSLVARGRRVLGYRFAGPWADIGTPERYLELNRLLLRSGCDGLSPAVGIHNGAFVSESCAGRGTTIARGARVVGSVLWENVAIGAGAVVEDCVLADGVTVGESAVLRGAIAGADAVIAPHANVPEGVLIEAGTTYGEQT